jgi:hypothetical protein
MTLRFDQLGNVVMNFLNAIARAISSQASKEWAAGFLGWLRGPGERPSVGATGTAGGTEAGVVPFYEYHEGSHGVIRVVPKLHAGSDEYLAMLQTGERVLSRKEVAEGGGSPNIVINVENRTGAQVKARQSGPAFDGKKWVKSVILELAQGDMDTRSILGLR